MSSPPRPIDRDELLWQLCSVADDHGHELPSDEVLQAYRSGTLSAAARNQVEATLAYSMEARLQLIELARLECCGPDEQLRGKVLALAVRPRRTLLFLAAAAVALFAAVGLKVLHRSQPLPSLGEYEIRAAGLVPVRAEEAPAGAISAYPDTEVRIDVSPRAATDEVTDFGLYRVNGSRFERMMIGQGLSLTTAGGAARFSAPARVLVGTEPGRYTLCVVVTPPGDLPDTLLARPDTEPLYALTAGSRRRAYLLQLDLLEPAVLTPAPSIDGG